MQVFRTLDELGMLRLTIARHRIMQTRLLNLRRGLPRWIFEEVPMSRIERRTFHAAGVRNAAMPTLRDAAYLLPDKLPYSLIAT